MHHTKYSLLGYVWISISSVIIMCSSTYVFLKDTYLCHFEPTVCIWSFSASWDMSKGLFWVLFGASGSGAVTPKHVKAQDIDKSQADNILGA